jgi:putative ABC transport system ATP-binding protein
MITAMSLLLQCNRLEKYYAVAKTAGMRTWVLRNITMDIQKGEFVSIMGPSGSGKSTLLHILGMLDEPSAGEYFFDGNPVHELNERKRSELHKHHIGFVFQSYHLIDELTVEENIEAPLLYQKISASERKSRVADMLDRFHIVAKKDLFPHQLSGGQQQVVGIARALIIQPSVILADEPTGNLNSTQGREIMETFQALHKQGTTIIQVTHSEINAQYGSRIIHLLDGDIEREEYPGHSH